MTADFLNHSQGNTSIAHLSESRAAEAVGASSLNADSLESFSQYQASRVGVDVTQAGIVRLAWEEIRLPC
jgi:hypothetical protein